MPVVAAYQYTTKSVSASSLKDLPQGSKEILQHHYFLMYEGK